MKRDELESLFFSEVFCSPRNVFFSSQNIFRGFTLIISSKFMVFLSYREYLVLTVPNGIIYKRGNTFFLGHVAIKKKS